MSSSKLSLKALGLTVLETVLNKMGISILPDLELRKPVIDLTGASTWAECQRLVEEHPQLLSNEAEQILRQGQEGARLRQAIGISQRYDIYINLLRRCREVGIKNAFAEISDATESIDELIDEVRQAQELSRDEFETNDQVTLEQTAAKWQKFLEHPAFALVPAGLRAGMFEKAGLFFLHSYQASSHEDHLKRALYFLNKALDSIPLGSPERARHLSNLAGGLYERHLRTGSHEVLERIIILCLKAVELTPQTSKELPRYLSELGVALYERYLRLGEPNDLQKAIEACQQAVKFTTPNSWAWPRHLSNLGLVLGHRYQHAGDSADLDQAISYLQKSVDILFPVDSQGLLPGTLNNLANNLRHRYVYVSGDLTDLERAIEAYQRALELIDDSSPHQHRCYDNLGNSLKNQYERTGNLDDLQQATDAYQQAVNLTPPTSPEWAGHLYNLGNTLISRYKYTNDFVHLEYALEACRQAVALTHEKDPRKPIYLNGLSSILNTLYNLSHPPPLFLLQEAINNSEQALNLISENSPNRPDLLDSLGRQLANLYEQTNKPKELLQAIDSHQQAVDLTPNDSPNLPLRLNNLGNVFKLRYTSTRNRLDLEKGQAAYREACQKSMMAGLGQALHSSHNWGEWALEREAWSEAAEAYAYGVQAVERLVQEQLLRIQKESWLGQTQGLFARAAYAYARIGQLEEAVTTLEHGRAFLLSEALEQKRADLERLPEFGHDELYQEYNQLSNTLFVLESQGDFSYSRNEEYTLTVIGYENLTGHKLPQGFQFPLMNPMLGHDSKQVQNTSRLRQVRIELRQLIERIRQIEGYEDFFRAPTFADVQQAISGQVRQVLVYTAVTLVGGLALIVQPDANISAVWLDDLTEKAVRERLNGSADEKERGGYLGAYERYKGEQAANHDAPRLLGSEAARQAWFTALDETTRWLWEVLMGPVTSGIAKIEGQFDEVVLIPQGLLGLLPLHAAWTEVRTVNATSRRYALDTIRFTYAPNARALTAAREKANIPPDTLFAVDNPDGSLHFSKPEVMAAGAHFEQKKILDHKTATRQAVQQELPSYSVLHFSTHGKAGWNDPLSSGLKLANGTQITLRDIFALRLDKARLAVLSACETGVPSTELPDEVVSLPTGLVQAGVPCVVASLWAVPDISTAILMERFYHNHRKGGMDFVGALHEAQKWVRDLPIGEVAKYAETCDQQFKWDKKAKVELFKLMRNYQYRAQQNPSERPFAHPYYWAAFTVNGM